MKTRLKILLALVLTAGLLTACGDPESECLEQNAPARTSYPEAPYGKSKGSKLENHSFLNGDGSAFSLGHIQQDGNKRLLLLSTSAGWCTACIEEQPQIQAWYEQYGCRGLDVMVALFEDANSQAADASLAENWKSQYGLSFNVVADPTFVLGAYYDSSLTPMNMLVDLETMEIAEIVID